ncbi:MAG: AAA family ATPase [Defluviitaleaceae bacterium]|nr:AAA family ATPase [Defluviitaleaceae bacterium]
MIKKLLIIFGAGAVGKMTVGQALTRITPLRLYHGHMDIELGIDIFGYRKAALDKRIREAVFEEFAADDQQYGLIFTYMWALDRPEDWAYIDGMVDIFRRRGADIYYVELVAPQAIRLQRHTVDNENRLANKKSKRDLAWSTALLKNEDEKFRLLSNDGEMPFENYMKIDNSELSPDDVAAMIKERFDL